MISPTALIAPEGLVEVGKMFPDETSAEVLDRLSQYIQEAEAKTADDDAVKEWAYYRAFMAVYVRLSAMPTDLDVKDQFAATVNIKQSERFKTMADGHLANWNRMVKSNTVEGNGGGTVGVPTRYRW